MAVNHQKCSGFGIHSMSNLCGRVIAALEEGRFLHSHYPILTDWGVRDVDVVVHSLGCSAWTLLGHKLGYTAISECPIPAAVGSDIRSDSVWISLQSQNPEVIIEFERYDGSARGKAKLDEKTNNLMEAVVRWQDAPQLLILSTWSPGLVSAPDTSTLQAKLRKGFRNSSGVYIPGITQVKLLFYRFIFEQRQDQLLRLHKIHWVEL